MTRTTVIASLTIILSSAIGAALIRFIAPQLFGVPVDMQVVQLDKAIPPFFDSTLRSSDAHEPQLLINDPVVGVRGKPFLPAVHGFGPHDLLGFRNSGVPRIADVIVLGDSQTYGNNALLSQNWPTQLEELLANVSVYAMAIGSWSGPQYLMMMRKAFAFQPQAVVIAFYTGNDSLEAFRSAYSIESFADLQIDKTVSIDSLPNYPSVPQPKDIWRVALGADTTVAFNPKRRLLANDSNQPAARIGYEILKGIVGKIGALAQSSGVKTFVTIIPTKELAFHPLLLSKQITLSPVYEELIKAERSQIQKLKGTIDSASDVTYIDTMTPLQDAVSSSPMVYPLDPDGHPLVLGYTVIAQTVAEAIRSAVPVLEDGAYKVTVSDKERWYYLLRNGELWKFSSESSVQDSSWDEKPFIEVPHRQIARYQLSGIIDATNPDNFSPHQ